jgi:hypothetical protein
MQAKYVDNSPETDFIDLIISSLECFMARVHRHDVRSSLDF